LAAGVVLSAALVAGCGSGPSQVGAAAIVGDTAIPVEYVQSWWDRYLATPEIKEQLRAGGNFDDLGRLIVGQAVRHELLRVVARQERLQFDEAEVSELIEQLGGEQAAVEATGSVYDSNTIRDRARDQLLAVALGRKYFERTGVRYDFTGVGSREQAQAKVDQFTRDPDGIQDVIEADKAAGAQTGVDIEQTMADSIEYTINAPLFSVPANTVVAYPDPDQANQGQWIVAVVHERSTDGSIESSSNATSLDDVDQGRLEGVGLQILSFMARDIGVRVSPRYGVWSDVYLTAAETAGEVPAIVAPLN
jgi:hypothetical protein